MLPDTLIAPAWPAPARVQACFTTRQGGVSVAPYNSLNLGTHVGDDPAAVAENRARVSALLPAEPLWLEQVHGTEVCSDARPGLRTADAAVTRVPGRVCAVMVADCLPVLLCDRAGSVVGAAHAGWRGLAAGVLARTVAAMACAPDQVLAWIGPAIGPQAFEVGPEVRDAFLAEDDGLGLAFRPGREDRLWCDLPALARAMLARAGVLPASVTGGGYCTVSDPARFFSFRRDGRTGRMAGLIWLADREAS